MHACSAKSTLNPISIYGSVLKAQACLNMTWTAARQVLASTPNNPAPNCLRMAFHGERQASKNMMNSILPIYSVQ